MRRYRYDALRSCPRESGHRCCDPSLPARISVPGRGAPCFPDSAAASPDMRRESCRQNSAEQNEWCLLRRLFQCKRGGHCTAPFPACAWLTPPVPLRLFSVCSHTLEVLLETVRGGRTWEGCMQLHTQYLYTPTRYDSRGCTVTDYVGTHTPLSALAVPLWHLAHHAPHVSLDQEGPAGRH